MLDKIGFIRYNKDASSASALPGQAAKSAPPIGGDFFPATFIAFFARGKNV